MSSTACLTCGTSWLKGAGMIDYSHLIEPVARHFWGEPNEQQSKPGELRFGSHGSKSVHLDKGTFYDHEALRGGGVLDMVKYATKAKTKKDAHAWRVVNKPPIVFVRGEAMQPLPQPVGGGSLGMLWELVNVPVESRLLVAAFIVDSYRTDGPFPGLELLGEQGSGKSLTAKFLRRLIDPNACDLRGAPKSVEDVFVVGGHSHMVTFENISHLHGPLQDALCILSTGGGIAKRTLYSDSEETIISVQRPWIINGIAAAVTQQDLLDRTISIDCPVLEQRGTATGMNATFEENHAALLGAVLEVAAKALALLPTIKLPPRDRPRLAEFAMLGMAVAQAMGHEPAEFMRQFNASRRESIARVLDASPVAAAVLEFVAKTPLGIEASVKDILTRLEDFKPAGAEAWPRTPKGLGDALRRAAPALRQMDVEVKSLGNVGGKVRCPTWREIKSAWKTWIAPALTMGQTPADMGCCA